MIRRRCVSVSCRRSGQSGWFTVSGAESVEKNRRSFARSVPTRTLVAQWYEAHLLPAVAERTISLPTRRRWRRHAIDDATLGLTCQIRAAQQQHWLFNPAALVTRTELRVYSIRPRSRKSCAATVTVARRTPSSLASAWWL